MRRIKWVLWVALLPIIVLRGLVGWLWEAGVETWRQHVVLREIMRRIREDERQDLDGHYQKALQDRAKRRARSTGEGPK